MQLCCCAYLNKNCPIGHLHTANSGKSCTAANAMVCAVMNAVSMHKQRHFAQTCHVNMRDHCHDCTAAIGEAGEMVIWPYDEYGNRVTRRPNPGAFLAQTQGPGAMQSDVILHDSGKILIRCVVSLQTSCFRVALQLSRTFVKAVWMNA